MTLLYLEKIEIQYYHFNKLKAVYDWMKNIDFKTVLKNFISLDNNKMIECYKVKHARWLISEFSKWFFLLDNLRKYTNQKISMQLCGNYLNIFATIL